MNGKVLLLLAFVLIGCTQSGDDKAPARDPDMFRTEDWMIPQYIANYDTINLVAVDKIPASIRLNRYIASIVTDTTIALRFINDTDNHIVDQLKYVWKGDTVATMPVDTMYIISICWILQNDPDSLRYVFIRNINDPQDTAIVDTTVFAPMPLQRIESWGLLDSATVAANNWPFTNIDLYPSGLKGIGFRKPFYHRTGYRQTICDYWSRRHKFRLLFASLYHPWYCGRAQMDKKTDDILLLFDVLGLLCRAQEVGAFRNAFTVPLLILDKETNDYRRIE